MSKRRSLKSNEKVGVIVPPKSLQFHFIKSGAYQTLHVDGAICSVTAQTNLSVTVYNERASIPQQITHLIKEDGTTGEISELEGKTGMVRQLEATLVISPNVAVGIIQQLKQQLDALVEKGAYKYPVKLAPPIQLQRTNKKGKK